MNTVELKIPMSGVYMKPVCIDTYGSLYGVTDTGIQVYLSSIKMISRSRALQVSNTGELLYTQLYCIYEWATCIPYLYP